MKRLTLISSWIITTSLTLFTAVSFYTTINQTKSINELINHEVKNFVSNNNTVMAYAALPGLTSEIQTTVLGADARPVTIDAYLEKYASPLAGYGKYIVTTADQYGLDPYLIVAIAQQESNLCKIIPIESSNCWGWGVHKKGTLKFSSYEDAITAVTKGLKTEYFDKGYDTPEKIMSKYTPQSQGSWAYGIHQFLKELNSGNF